MGTLPFALVGGVWLLYLQGYSLSVATGVGFVALSGVASEFGVIMLLYLKRAAAARQEQGADLTPDVLDGAIREGAVLRVRPKAMTVAVILAGLITASLLSMLVIPVAYRLMRQARPPRNTWFGLRFGKGES